jgi:hypothetical protein
MSELTKFIYKEEQLELNSLEMRTASIHYYLIPGNAWEILKLYANSSRTLTAEELKLINQVEGAKKTRIQELQGRIANGAKWLNAQLAKMAGTVDEKEGEKLDKHFFDGLTKYEELVRELEWLSENLPPSESGTQNSFNLAPAPSAAQKGSTPLSVSAT